MSRGSLEKRIINLTRRRLIANYINAMISPLFAFAFAFIVVYFGGNKEIGVVCILLSAIFGLMFQYGIFVVLTNGYTPGGLIMGLKIIKLNGEKLKLWEVVKRFLSAWNFMLEFYFFIHTKVNTLGQFYYDKKFNTTVVGSGYAMPECDTVYDLEHNYLKEILIFFTVLVLVSNFLTILLK